MTNPLLKFPWLFYPIFVSVLVLSQKCQVGLKRTIPQRLVKRLVLYSSGPIMGSSYAIAGLIGIISRPFDKERCGSSDDVEYLQQFVYTVLFPTGVAMGGVHIGMFKARYGKASKPGVCENTPGKTVGNAEAILCCCLVQVCWLVILFTWAAGVFAKCETTDAPILAILLFSGIATSIIVTVLMARAVCALLAHAEREQFCEIYCGGIKSDDECTAMKQPHPPRQGTCPFWRSAAVSKFYIDEGSPMKEESATGSS